jgi:putative ABC transport system permease protein
MRLAWKMILSDRARSLATALGIAFSVFLMVFLGSLLMGFLRASSKVIDSTDADLWITARGVTCFDFSALLARRTENLAYGIPGIAATSRLMIAFPMYRRPDGSHRMVALVGADPGVGRGFPLPLTPNSAEAMEPDTAVVDRSDLVTLGITAFPQEAQVNRRHITLLGYREGFSSFIGCPYVFTSYESAARYAGLPGEEGMNILVRVAPGWQAGAVKKLLQVRFPEASVWTRDEFSRQSRTFWVIQTGAGGGILIAALLGFLIGTVIASQQIYATTMENIEEFATLKALGASRWFVVRVLLAQALICGVGGSVPGVALAVPLVRLTQRFIAWIYTPWWLPVLMVPPSLIMCCAAAILSVRAALNVDPARVFRA